MTVVFISFQVTVNALKVLLQYIESDELGMMCINFVVCKQAHLCEFGEHYMADLPSCKGMD